MPQPLTHHLHRDAPAQAGIGMVQTVNGQDAHTHRSADAFHIPLQVVRIQRAPKRIHEDAPAVQPDPLALRGQRVAIGRSLEQVSGLAQFKAQLGECSLCPIAPQLSALAGVTTQFQPYRPKTATEEDRS